VACPQEIGSNPLAEKKTAQCAMSPWQILLQIPLQAFLVGDSVAVMRRNVAGRL
jgi:hypothetical protein